METAQPVISEITYYLPHLNSEQQKAVLTVVKTFAAATADWWDEISSAQQEAIDVAVDEMESGKVIPHSEVMNKYNQWR